MKISITLANYNHGRYLETYFAGIRGQTYQDWELIITDDGSTDNSREIIRRHAAEDLRIKVNEFPENRGSLPAFYNCYNQTTGELIYATASDDYLLDPRFLEKAATAFAQKPEMGTYFGIEEIRDADDGTLHCLDGRAPKVGFVQPSECIAAFLRKELLIPGCTAVVRKACLDDFGGFPADLGPNCDYYLNHAVAGRYGVWFANDVVAYARIDRRRKNLSMQMPLRQRLHNTYEITRRFLADGLVQPTARGSLIVWLNAEVRQAICCTYDSVWTLKHLRSLYEGCLNQPGLTSAFREVSFRALMDAVEHEERTIAAFVIAELAHFDEQIGHLVVGYHTDIKESSFRGVLAFIDERPDIRRQIAAQLAFHEPSIRRFAKVVFYGMGSHTQTLIEEWKRVGLPPPSGATNSDTTGGGLYQTIPIIALEAANEAGLLIVVSSLSYEGVMFDTVRKRAPRAAVLSFWNPGLTTI